MVYHMGKMIIDHLAAPKESMRSPIFNIQQMAIVGALERSTAIS